MRRTLFDLGPLELHSYTTLLCLSFILGTALALYRNYRRPAPYPLSPIFGVWVVLGVLFGARAFHVVQFGEPPCSMFRLADAGLVFFGGLAGGIVSAAIYARVVGVPILAFLDLLTPGLVLGEAVTRLGCFLNGCCWGKPFVASWAVTYPPNSFPFRQQVGDGIIDDGAVCSAAVHPFQLYMMAMLIAVFIAIIVIERRWNRKGDVVRAYVLLYGIGRFLLEPFRGDSGRPWLGMSVSQGISLAMVLVALAWMLGRAISKRGCSIRIDEDTANTGLADERAREGAEGGRERMNTQRRIIGICMTWLFAVGCFGLSAKAPIVADLVGSPAPLSVTELCVISGGQTCTCPTTDCTADARLDHCYWDETQGCIGCGAQAVIRLPYGRHNPCLYNGNTNYAGCCMNYGLCGAPCGFTVCSYRLVANKTDCGHWTIPNDPSDPDNACNTAIKATCAWPAA